MHLRLGSILQALIVNMQICMDSMNQRHHIFTGPVILQHQTPNP